LGFIVKYILFGLGIIHTAACPAKKNAAVGEHPGGKAVVTAESNGQMDRQRREKSA
jgi:hypothetical protein